MNSRIESLLERLHALERRADAVDVGVDAPAESARDAPAESARDATGGEPGPMGPMPEHEWSGTEIRFQQGPTGAAWGPWVDLQGPTGRPGASYGPHIGGGAANPAPTFSYWPGGW